MRDVTCSFTWLSHLLDFVNSTQEETVLRLIKMFIGKTEGHYVCTSMQILRGIGLKYRSHSNFSDAKTHQFLNDF